MEAYVSKPSQRHHTSLVPSDGEYPVHWTVSYNPLKFKGGYETGVASQIIKLLEEEHSGLLFKNEGLPSQNKVEVDWDNHGGSSKKGRDATLDVVVQGDVARVFLSVDGHVALILKKSPLPQKRRVVSVHTPA